MSTSSDQESGTAGTGWRDRVVGLLGPRDRAFRALSAAQFVNMLGTGAYLVGATLYFTRVLGLSPSRVGVVLSVASLTGLLVAVPAGRLADRWGPRRVFIGTQAVQAIAVCGLTVVHGFGWFLICATVAAMGQRSAVSTGGALVAALSAQGSRTRRRAYLRAVTNLGQAVGTLGAGLALADGSHGALRLLVLLNGLSFAVGVLLLLRVPRAVDSDRQPRPPQSRSALRHKGYVAVSVLCGVLAVHYDVFAVAIPVYVATRTHAPLWLVSVLVTINTVAVVVLQVRASRGVEGASKAGRYARSSGLVVAVAFVIIGLDQLITSAPWSAAVLVIGVLVLTGGELIYGPASFELSYALASEGQHGEYQGVFGLASGVVRAAAPITVMLLCVRLGVAGWVILAVLVLVCAAAVVPIAARVADNNRRRDAVDVRVAV